MHGDLDINGIQAATTLARSAAQLPNTYISRARMHSQHHRAASAPAAFGAPEQRLFADRGQPREPSGARPLIGAESAAVIGTAQARHHGPAHELVAGFAQWALDEASFDRSAVTFDNPGHVAITIHNYRWRLGARQRRQCWHRQAREACEGGRHAPWRRRSKRTSLPRTAAQIGAGARGSGQREMDIQAPALLCGTPLRPVCACAVNSIAP